MHLVSGCVLVPPLRKPGTEGLSLIGETDMFPAGASFTSGSFATRRLAMVARLGCSSPVMSLNSCGGADCVPFSADSRVGFERAEEGSFVDTHYLDPAVFRFGQFDCLRIRTCHPG